MCLRVPRVPRVPRVLCVVDRVAPALQVGELVLQAGRRGLSGASVWGSRTGPDCVDP